MSVEAIKRASRGLRGTIVESLADPTTAALRDDDGQLLKFHGSYQQDDRDRREPRRLAKLEPAVSFMLRTRLPAGVATPAQWLALDAVARRYANGTLRLTTRQAIQLHGVIKEDLKPTLAAINASLVDTIGACGDVNRNVIAAAHLLDPALHAALHEDAAALSRHFLPKTRAYHEIWLDAQAANDEPVDEPVYGETFLPRKFKIAIAAPPVNDVDVHAHDLGFVAIVEDGTLVGYDVTVGGGLGATHGDPSTYPRLADTIGSIARADLLAVATAVVTLQRDHGDRVDRRHARFKYTVERLGLDRVRAEVESRAGVTLAPARGFRFAHNGDAYGWHVDDAGRHRYGLDVRAGRIAGALLDALRDIAARGLAQFRLTPNQGLALVGVDDTGRNEIEAILSSAHAAAANESLTARNALACVALPTCPLAMAEAERYLPDFVAKLDALLDRHGVREPGVRLRITGCPNGCARPYLAELALIGKAPGRYNVHVGGDVAGTRLARRVRENLDESAILAYLDALVARWAGDRAPDEAFGDWAWRAGVVHAELPR